MTEKTVTDCGEQRPARMFKRWCLDKKSRVQPEDDCRVCRYRKDTPLAILCRLAMRGGETEERRW